MENIFLNYIMISTLIFLDFSHVALFTLHTNILHRLYMYITIAKMKINIIIENDLTSFV